MKLYNANYIKTSINPLDFYGYELNQTFRKSGWVESGLCPFHDDHKKGNFFVNTVTGSFKCFSCGACGSDIVAFTMTLYAIDFVDALRYLAEEWSL